MGIQTYIPINTNVVMKSLAEFYTKLLHHTIFKKYILIYQILILTLYYFSIYLKLAYRIFIM